MRIYGIINGTADIVQTAAFCTWEFERYNEDGTTTSYIGFECTNESLIPDNGTVIEDFRSWLNQYAPTEI
jgi:hypothetical protein